MSGIGSIGLSSVPSGLSATGLRALQYQQQAQTALTAYNQAQQYQNQQYLEHINTFMPPEEHLLFLRELIRYHISEKDAAGIIRIICDYISKEEREIKLDEQIETSLLQWLIEKQA